MSHLALPALLLSMLLLHCTGVSYAGLPTRCTVGRPRPAIHGCSNPVIRFYYQTQNKKCASFDYYPTCTLFDSGNNFETLEDCQRTCVDVTTPGSPTTVPPIEVNISNPICKLEKDTGIFDIVSIGAYHFFFNMTSLCCEEFYFTKKGGNANNFETMDDCRKTCYVVSTTNSSITSTTTVTRSPTLSLKSTSSKPTTTNNYLHTTARVTSTALSSSLSTSYHLLLPTSTSIVVPSIIVISKDESNTGDKSSFSVYKFYLYAGMVTGMLLLAFLIVSGIILTAICLYYRPQQRTRHSATRVIVEACPNKYFVKEQDHHCSSSSSSESANSTMSIDV